MQMANSFRMKVVENKRKTFKTTHQNYISLKPNKHVLKHALFVSRVLIEI